MITIWLFGVTWLYHSKRCCCTFIVLIWCSRGKAEDFSTSNCFSFSDIHKEKVSNVVPNSSHWVFISSRVLMLKQKSVNHKLTKIKILVNKKSCDHITWYISNFIYEALYFQYYMRLKTESTINWNSAWGLIKQLAKTTINKSILLCLEPSRHFVHLVTEGLSLLYKQSLVLWTELDFCCSLQQSAHMWDLRFTLLQQHLFTR